MVIAEGGFGELAIQGMEELVTELPTCDHIYTAVGTGATAIGIAQYFNGTVNGILTLNNKTEITDHLKFHPKPNLMIDDQYIFGKYAKQTILLDQFCEEFNTKYNIAIEAIYTGRMFYALVDHIKNGHIAPYSKLVAIHTGGVK